MKENETVTSNIDVLRTAGYYFYCFHFIFTLKKRKISPLDFLFQKFEI